MKEDPFSIIRKSLIAIFLMSLVVILITLLISTNNNDLVNDIQTFIESDTKVLYISNKDSYSKYQLTARIYQIMKE